MGSRKVTGCWCFPRQISLVGTLWAPPPIPTTMDVCPCWGHWAKGTWSCYLPGLLTAFVWARFKCGGPHHQAHGSTWEEVWGVYNEVYHLKRAPRPNPQSEFQRKVSATYDHFKDLKEGSCEEALAMAWDAHRWALVATALLEDKIEKLSCSISHGHQWLGNCM